MKVWNKIKELLTDRRAAISLQDLIYAAVGFVLVGYLTPIGLAAVINATLGGVSTTIKTIFQVVLPLMYIIGAALVFIPRAKK